MCFCGNNLVSDSEDLYLLGHRERPSFPKLTMISHRNFIHSHKHHLHVVIPVYLISKIKYKNSIKGTT